MYLILYIAIGVLIDQKWQKFYQFWGTLLFQLVFLEN